jgi:porin
MDLVMGGFTFMKRCILRIAVHAWLIAAVTAAPVLAKDADGSTNWFAQGLEDLGINLRGSEIDQWARNPSGGVAEGDTNVGQLQFGADLDLKRLLGIEGGSFHFVIYRDYGQALNQNFTGTFTKQQYIYKNAFPQLHLGLFAYEQKLLDNRLDIQLGRLGSTTYYGHLVTNCQFMSGTTCGEPRMLVAETGLSLLPSATWGTNVKFRSTAHTYIESGIFEVNPTTAPSNGLHFSVNQATGYTVPTEFGWVNGDPNTTPYPFELKAGAYVSTAPLADPYYNTLGLSRGLHGGTAREDSFVRDGIYVMGDRVIWRPDPDRPTSINVFGGIVQQLEEAEIMRQQIYAGFVWTAPSALRPKDTLGLSISEFELTPGERYFLRDARIKAGGSGTNAAHQIAYDLTYSVHLWRGVELMPSLQYIQHPDNSTITRTTTVPANLFVYGIGIRMDLGYMAGFMRGGPSD